MRTERSLRNDSPERGTERGRSRHLRDRIVRNARLRRNLNAMSGLLSLTAIIEAATGLALLIAPSLVVRLMLGSPLESYAAVTLGHIAGAALLALSVAAWLARGDEQGRAARGLVTAIMIYNLGVAVILGTAGIQTQLVGIALWPAVVLHAAMAAWCIMSLLKKGPLEIRSSAG
jgi:hypothetical protein